MKYINLFKTHASYEEKLNVGGVDISLPNVSYCKDVKDVHYNPYNIVEFYVGDITGTTPQTVKIYTSYTTYISIQVSEGNKWYTYVLPKDKVLFAITGNFVKNVTIKANISYVANYTPPFTYTNIIPSSTVEASFKGSNTSNLNSMGRMFNGCTSLASLDLSNFNTSNVTSMSDVFNRCSSLTSLDVSNFDTSKVVSMSGMFNGCSSLTSLDLSGWDTSNVESTNDMFSGCSKLTTIRMVGCSTRTIDKIRGVKPSSATIVEQ